MTNGTDAQRAVSETQDTKPAATQESPVITGDEQTRTQAIDVLNKLSIAGFAKNIPAIKKILE